jgi:hypothetical protein
VFSHSVNVELFPVPPTIHEQPVPLVVFREGDVITLSCIATGHPEPQYEWFKENFKLLGEETSTLTVRLIYIITAKYVNDILVQTGIM